METDKARIRTCNLTRPVGHQYPSREWALCGTASTLLAINLRNIASWFVFFFPFFPSILRNYAINKGQALPSNSKIRSRKRLWIIWKGILYNRAFFSCYHCTCRRVRSLFIVALLVYVTRYEFIGYKMAPNVMNWTVNVIDGYVTLWRIKVDISFICIRTIAYNYPRTGRFILSQLFCQLIFIATCVSMEFITDDHFILRSIVQ